MKRLEDQGRFRRFARQDNNKITIEDLTKSLEDAMETFDVSFLGLILVLKLLRASQTNLQLSVYRLQMEARSVFVELDQVSRERHGEVLDVSRTSGKEREVTSCADC
jgi:hypothetical protein